MGGGLAEAAPPPSPATFVPSFSSDTSESDLKTGETLFRGSCRYQEGNVLLTADEFRYNSQTNLLIATGHTTLTWGDERLLADELDYYRQKGSFSALHIRVGRYPFYIQGQSADGTIFVQGQSVPGTKTEIFIHHASITYTDPGRWKPAIKAETIVYSPGRYLRMVRSMVGLHNAEIIPLGALDQNLTTAFGLADFSLAVGYRSSLGGTADIGMRVPVLTGVRFGGDLGIYTSRGAMIGPSADYFDSKNDGDIVGWFRSGWISDYGQRLTDVLGNQVPRDREYAEWTHQQRIGDHVTLTADINWWSDSDVIRDFNPKQFYQDQNPDSYVEAMDSGDNYFASVFARFRPNTWEAVQERLPEFSYNLLPSALGGGFYQRLETSAVDLRELPPTGGPELASDRLDAFYEVSYPFTPTNWFAFTPVAGARVTDYFDTQGAAQPGGYLRTLGEVGFDAQMRSSGTFNYQNPVWEIDGLRHLFTPTLSYRYIPDATQGQNFIPKIDGQTFNTYLPPLDLGDVSYLDQLHSENTLRLGLNNTLQTREDGYGSRDLVLFNVADDINFERTAEEPDFSDLHFDLALIPTRWLEYDVTEIVDPEKFQLYEFTSGLILHDGNAWSLHLGNDFVRHEDDNYILDYMLRLNERFQVTFLAEYDARIHVINRVAAGLTQNLANTWKLQYLLVFNGGPNREGKVGFQVQVDVLRF